MVGRGAESHRVSSDLEKEGLQEQELWEQSLDVDRVVKRDRSGVRHPLLTSTSPEGSVR